MVNRFSATLVETTGKILELLNAIGEYTNGTTGIRVRVLNGIRRGLPTTVRTRVYNVPVRGGTICRSSRLTTGWERDL